MILTGAGDKAFIAGADISELAHVTAVEAEQSSAFGQTVLNLIENLGNPVIAADQWLRTGRRLRDGHGMHDSHRLGKREVRPA